MWRACDLLKTSPCPKAHVRTGAAVDLVGGRGLKRFKALSARRPIASSVCRFIPFAVKRGCIFCSASMESLSSDLLTARLVSLACKKTRGMPRLHCLDLPLPLRTKSCEVKRLLESIFECAVGEPDPAKKSKPSTCHAST